MCRECLILRSKLYAASDEVIPELDDQGNLTEACKQQIMAVRNGEKYQQALKEYTTHLTQEHHIRKS